MGPGATRSIAQMVKRVALLAGVVLVSLFLFAQFVRRTGMFFPEQYPSGQWDTTALPVQPTDQAINSSDGVRLHGWYFQTKTPNAPVVIWFHGNGGNITHRADTAAELAQRGLSVLLFDWRGYGKSAGKPRESKLYLDALAAYDFTASTLRVPPDRIVLYGESLGGPFAAFVAKERKARAVIIENSLPSLRALGNDLYRPLPLGWFAPFAMATTSWLNEARIPVLVMHGRKDQVIPFRLGQQLYDDLDVPKEMLVSEHSDHSEIPTVDAERYYEAVVRFSRSPHPPSAPSPR